MRSCFGIVRTVSAACFVIGWISFPALPVAAEDAEPAFDHTATRFVLTGAHEGVPCEGCHAMGVFRGTPTDCSFCHDGSGMRAESGKPLDHIQSSNRCEDCHVTFGWSEVHFDHADVSGNCAGCHNGVQAPGKPMDHITTTANCDSCHNTFTWGGVRFDHSGVTEPCSNCHDGMKATGKPMDHVTTNAECDDCHSTRAWTPASFDHAGVTEPCSNCHNGMRATGKPNDHLRTTAECDLCHTTMAWRPAHFDHSGVTGQCSSCHNGMEATGTPNGHFMTSQECDYCHNTNAWTPDTFRHMSPFYPGDHRRALTCRDCHGGNSETVTWTSPTYAQSCAGCHANDYRRGEGRHTNLSNDRNCGQSGCHSVNDRSFND